MSKLKTLRHALFDWSRADTSNSARRLADLDSALRTSLAAAVIDWAEVHRLEGERANAHVQEERYWRQQGRNSWLKERDRNTAYFHRSVIAPRKRKRIEVLEADGELLHDEQLKGQHAVAFYESLFSTEHTTLTVDLAHLQILPLLTDSMNSALLAEVSASHPCFELRGMTMKEKEEGEGGESKACSWEEEIYWTHFQFTHFFRLLHAGFHLTLAMPTRFSNSLKSKLPKTVTLTGPSGANWTVELTKTAGTMFFTRGWKEFAADNSLQVDDLLVFKYNGDSHFDVLILESRTSCEKATAYFAKKKKKKKNNGGDIQPSVISVDSEKIIENSGGGVCPVSPPSCDGIPAVDSPGSSTDWQPVSSGECNKRAKVKDKVGRWRRVVEMNRRVVTEESKREALRLASHAAAPKQDSFISVMKTSSVCTAYYLSVPSLWMKKHVNKYWEAQEVILKVEENEWPVKFRPKRKKNVSWGGFGGGWRIFAQDNHLQLFDVCLFQPRTPTSNATLVLDVQIFRC
ncbi:B3 domain-containing protein REM16 [Linum grandiflorum]